MKALLQTAFIVFVLFTFSFSVVYAQDFDDDLTDDDLTDETMEEKPKKNDYTWESSLFDLLVGISMEKKISMIITPECQEVKVWVNIFNVSMEKAIKEAEEAAEANGTSKKKIYIADILDMVLETYGYVSEVRNGVYIIQPLKESSKKDSIVIQTTRPYDIPKYFRFSEIVEQFNSFIGEGDKIISNSSSRVIFVMATLSAIDKISEYFKVIDEKADKEMDYSLEEGYARNAAKKTVISEEAEEKIEIKKKLFIFPNQMEQVLVDLRNLMPIPLDSDIDPWTIINEDERMILITGTDNDLGMIEEYITNIKLTQGLDIEVPLAEKIDTRVYTLSRPVEEVSKDLKSFLTDKGVIVVNPEKNFIIIKDRVTNFVLLERFVLELDAEPQQVYIEATFMELKLDHDFRFGFDSAWSQTEGTTDFTSASSGGTSGFSFGVVQSNKDNLWSLKLNTLSTNTDSNILSRPRVLIMNGKQARIVVGQEVPYLTTEEGASGGSVQDVEFKDVSITMVVTPHVEPGDRVRMTIRISIMEQVGTVALGGNETPITSNRELETEVFVNSGDTLVMGGLYENKITESLTGLPIVGELPIIGSLFSTRINTNRKTDLLFFITPTIVKPKDEVDIIRKGRVLKFYKHTKPVEPAWLTDPSAKRLSR